MFKKILISNIENMYQNKDSTFDRDSIEEKAIQKYPFHLNDKTYVHATLNLSLAMNVILMIRLLME